MTVALGVMQLPVTEDPDRVRDYLNGTIAGGGLWTALARSSNHDHTGGNNGTPLSIAAIPDGSITVGKLDPSVLLPYALVDGSKPFTGQVSMDADAIVRDALFFGPQGSALPPDVTLTRTGAGLLSLGGAWHAPSGTWEVKTGAAPGATRVSLSQAGALTLSPDAGQTGLSALVGTGSEAARFTFSEGPGGAMAFKYNAVGAGWTSINSLNGGLTLGGAGGFVAPMVDNAYANGHPSVRWTTLYAVAGTINTSLAEAKTDITPLDPGACAQAVLDTDWVGFSYLPPAYVEPPETEGQAPEDRQRRVDEGRVAHAQMLVETQPVRDQKGYVLGSPDHGVSDLFGLSDRKSASPSTDLAVVACALQDALRRLAVLEGSG